MPITTDESGSIAIRMGTGDIAVGPAGENEFVFIPVAPAEIGACAHQFDGQTINTRDVPVRIIFGKIASLDTVIERMEFLRSIMANSADALTCPVPTEAELESDHRQEMQAEENGDFGGYDYDGVSRGMGGVV